MYGQLEFPECLEFNVFCFLKKDAAIPTHMDDFASHWIPCAANFPSGKGRRVDANDMQAACVFSLPVRIPVKSMRLKRSFEANDCLSGQYQKVWKPPGQTTLKDDLHSLPGDGRAVAHTPEERLCR